jgi:PhnB protein
MKSLNAYLSFDGNCREALKFYQDCLGGPELQLNPYPDASGQPSHDPTARIMHGQLVRSDGAPFLMASDTHEPGSLKGGNNFSISIDCSDVTEAEMLFEKLSDGGVVRMPLIDAPWGARFGMLTDRFGIQWMVNCLSESPDA